jgi:hypothetical protein
MCSVSNAVFPLLSPISRQQYEEVPGEVRLGTTEPVVQTVQVGYLLLYQLFNSTTEKRFVTFLIASSRRELTKTFFRY